MTGSLCVTPDSQLSLSDSVTVPVQPVVPAQAGMLDQYTGSVFVQLINISLKYRGKPFIKKSKQSIVWVQTGQTDVINSPPEMRLFFKEIFWASYDVFCLIIQISLWQDKTICEVWGTLAILLWQRHWPVVWCGVLSGEDSIYRKLPCGRRDGRARPESGLELNTFSKMPLPPPARGQDSHQHRPHLLPHPDPSQGGPLQEAGGGQGGCRPGKVSMCWSVGPAYDSPGSSWERVTGQWGSSEIRDVIARITNNADTGGRREEAAEDQLMLVILFLSGHISHSV